MKTSSARLRKSPSRTIVAGALLVAAGAIVFGVRSCGEQVSPAPGDTLWRITLALAVDAAEASTRIVIAPPFDTAYVQLVAQSVDLTGLRLLRQRTRRTDRDLILVADAAGAHRARIQFELRLGPLRTRGANMGSRPLSSKARERLLRPGPDIQSDAADFEDLAEMLLASRPATVSLADHFVDYLGKHIALVRQAQPDDALSALQTKRSTTAGIARATVALLRAGRIPARLVIGVVLDERRKRQPHLWLEAFTEGRWQAYDPEYGYLSEVPPNYVPLRRGDDRIVWIEAGGRLQSQLTVTRQVIAFEPGRTGVDAWLPVVDFGHLPESARATIGLLLLLPLGALVTVFARQLVGVRTYGIFSPALLALAAQFVDFATALVIVAVVATLGTAGRALLPGTLSRTPRLAIVFTLVALSMAIGVAVLLHLGRSAESVIVLLPVVVLANLVDRFYAVADESGLSVALTRLLWTAFAAVLCYLLFAREELGQWLVRHPEAHIVTIGLMICLGAYRGKKLAEWPWFQWLREGHARNDAEGAPLA